ncbi:hypothetical protein CS542_07425 [Pedobacter sp. IW39]|nr:hypothetical protein CS542_07425 [Pedobacter sp. IW39]
MEHQGNGIRFTKTIGAELLSGRDFAEEFGTDTSSVLLNESAESDGLKTRWELSFVKQEAHSRL